MGIIDYIKARKEKMDQYRVDQEAQRRASDIKRLKELKLKASIARHEAKVQSKIKQYKREIAAANAARSSASPNITGKVRGVLVGVGEFADQFNKASEKAGNYDFNFPGSGSKRKKKHKIRHGG